VIRGKPISTDTGSETNRMEPATSAVEIAAKVAA